LNLRGPRIPEGDPENFGGKVGEIPRRSSGDFEES
jgi:hypothetical protein